MPSIDIGADQADYLEELREALAETYLEGYGEMRTRDALQYLIDQHEAARGDGPLVGDAATADSPDDVDDAAADVALESSDAVTERAAVEETEANEAGADDIGATDEADDGSGEADAANATDESAAPSPGGSPLQQMMQLLEENDDVWEEVDSNDGKYAVELPDGTTEYARTKDDVRALLFKHYR
ncbi:hypothetical protein [Halarchaeum sp. P4]|uniref:hypothetical protein n=1 Tax=Halarchaeum sp. P4 TaxID=3421639 RepID=UPI003EBD8666